MMFGKEEVAFLEITILVLATISLSFMIGESYAEIDNIIIEKKESKIITLMRSVVISLLDDGMVSAQSVLWTCLKDKQGSYCQEYTADECNDKCDGACFPGPRENTLECALGTCIDENEGVCAPNSPKLLCENSGQTWSQQSATQIAECSLGCCLIGGEAKYVTDARCSVLKERTGIDVEFRPVSSELLCLALANPGAEGACILNDNACRFTTKQDCLTLRGEFNEGILCSAPALNTSCIKQDKTSCIEGKDEVYWVDSCGNRENIYDSDKERSYNNGRVLSKEQSCILGNAAACGNCNYLGGSVCGDYRLGKDTRPTYGSNVCRDLSCEDENGEIREHGESWCAFDGRIGLQGATGSNEERSADVAGSRHYKKICYEGEIRTEPCQDYRNEICTQTDTPRNDSSDTFSSAVCRLNQWQKCVEININARTESGIDTEKLQECEQYTDCYIKNVDIDEQFSFSMCAPKYPPGFDLRSEDGQADSQTICSVASQKCTYVKIRKLTGSKRINENCLTDEFTETMNNLCMSLGDCGGKVNVAGEYTDDGYSVGNAPELNDEYIEGLRDYAEAVEGQSADRLSDDEIARLFGIIESDPQIRDEKIGEMLGKIGLGASGLELAAWYFNLPTLVGGTTGPVPFLGQALPGVSPQLAAFGNAAAGAALGAAVGFVVGKLFGLQGEGLTHVVIAGAVSGAISGYFAGQALIGGNLGAGASGAFAALGIVLFWAIVVVVVVAIVMSLLGIGRAKKTTIEFQCLPWQPPKGGESCGECGSNGLPCSKYKCQSLGQTCEFINEGTSDEACVDLAPNDVNSPVISPNNNVLLPGFSYENISTFGYSLRGATTDGCLPAYSSVQLGIRLDEPGQCKFDSERKSFEDMDSYFNTFNSNLYVLNHTSAFVVPSLEFAEASVNESGINSSLRKDFALFVRCSDKKGNINDREYAINFCISPQNDLTPPIMRFIDEDRIEYAAIGAENKTAQFFVNEPAECKWSVQDMEYNSMENEASCASEIEDQNVFGWACSATLPVEDDENKFFFRCKDQPWLEQDIVGNRTRNANSQSVEYKIVETIDELEINSIKPNNQIIRGAGNLVPVTLEVQTSGGAPGNIYCNYRFGNFTSRFFSNIGNTHKQEFTNLMAGSYSIPISCEDDAGNIANDASNFTIELDDIGPKITRVYNLNGLVVVTDENAMCRFSLDSCGFSFNNGTLMQGSTLVHSFSPISDSTHYIRCKDNLGNVGQCLQVRKGLF